MGLLANIVWIVLSVLATGGAFLFGHGVGYRKGRRSAVDNAELGISDAFERTELPRPDAPPAVIRNIDYSRGRMQSEEDVDERW